MPGLGNPLIVGGGISGVSPLAIGEFLYLTSVDPPEASTTPRARLDASDVIFESAAGKGDTVIGPDTAQNGAQGADSVLIGNNVTAATAASGAGSANTGIGSDIAFGTGVGNVVIGEQVAAVSFGGGGSVYVGRIGSLGGGIRNSNVGIGNITSMTSSGSVAVGSAISTTGNNVVAIGASVSIGGQDNVAIGTGAQVGTGTNVVSIGRATTATGTTAAAILLGAGTVVASVSNFIAIGCGVVATGLAAGDMVLGNNNYGGTGFTSRVVWGGANLHTSGTAVPAFTHRHKNAQGTNVAAGNMIVIAPLGTGTGAPGDIIFQTADLAAAGTTLQTAVTRMAIRGDTGRIHIDQPSAATYNLHVDAVGGAGVPWIKVDNLTSGAGAAVGTLNNAPTAGDPAFWIPFQLDGVVHYIPAWT